MLAKNSQIRPMKGCRWGEIRQMLHLVLFLLLSLDKNNILWLYHAYLGYKNPIWPWRPSFNRACWPKMAKYGQWRATGEVKLDKILLLLHDISTLWNCKKHQGVVSQYQTLCVLLIIKNRIFTNGKPRYGWWKNWVICWLQMLRIKVISFHFFAKTLN